MRLDTQGSVHTASFALGKYQLEISDVQRHYAFDMVDIYSREKHAYLFPFLILFSLS